ncbi:hypothetical protein BDZ89DRAFT_1139958 [Hymenopellis radicata]|nr:hypothetical protein BDZ89DRAFT_1139958 [Hymenopellis radicata]
MTPYRSEEVPWHCLTDHVLFHGKNQSTLRPGSEEEARKASFLKFAHSLSYLVFQSVEEQLASIPKPDASREEWQAAGVFEDALFPHSILQPDSYHANRKAFARRAKWESLKGAQSADLLAAAAVVQSALFLPENPLQFLPSLVHLAQHPRVALSCIERITVANAYPWDPSPTKGPTQPQGIQIMVKLAISSFLDLNLAITQSSSTGNGLHIPRPYLNNTFSPLLSTEARHAQNHRCFLDIVALCTIITELVSRDRALGSDRRTFGAHNLALLILSQLEGLSAVFHVPGLLRAVQDLPALEPQNVTETPNQGTLACLPIEIQLHIYSFLPERCLLRLWTLCKTIRQVCLSLIYADPLSVIFPTPTSSDIAAYSRSADRLVGLLRTRPDLCSVVCSFRARAFSTLPPSGTLVKRTPPPGLCDPPLEELSLPNLQNLVLSFSASCRAYRCTNTARTCHEIFSAAVLGRVARQWPNLSSLTVHLYEIPHNFHLGVLPVIDNSAPESLPNSLVTLRITFKIAPWGPFCGHISQESSSLSHRIITASATTLHTLVVRISHKFPEMMRCSSLRILSLMTDLSSSDVERFLRCFPSLETLRLEPTNELCQLERERARQTEPRKVHVLRTVRHLQFSTLYHPYEIPGSIQTIAVEQTSMLSQAYNPRPSTEALLLRKWQSTDHLSLEEEVETIGLLFPQLRSFQVSQPWDCTPSAGQTDLLLTLGEAVSHSLPHLEVLVMTLARFEYRPSRCDYPLDDGIDDLQRRHAIDFFTTCPSLRVISFDGVPDVWDPTGRFPLRVWVKTSGEEENSVNARMGGRGDIPWKLDEFWQEIGVPIPE